MTCNAVLAKIQAVCACILSMHERQRSNKTEIFDVHAADVANSPFHPSENNN